MVISLNKRNSKKNLQEIYSIISLSAFFLLIDSVKVGKYYENPKGWILLGLVSFFALSLLIPFWTSIIKSLFDLVSLSDEEIKGHSGFIARNIAVSFVFILLYGLNLILTSIFGVDSAKAFENKVTFIAIVIASFLLSIIAGTVSFLVLNLYPKDEIPSHEKSGIISK